MTDETNVATPAAKKIRKPKAVKVKTERKVHENPIAKAFGPDGVVASKIVRAQDKANATADYKALLSALKNSGKDTAKLDRRISVLLARRDAIRSAAQTIDNFRPRLQRIADMIAGRDGKAV